MLLADRTVLVTGVLTPSSIAFTCARMAQEQGAEVVLTSFGRALSVTERAAKRLPTPPDVLELDVTDADHLDRAGRRRSSDRWDRLDGVVHAVGFAPAACLGQDDGLLGAELGRRRHRAPGVGLLARVAGPGRAAAAAARARRSSASTSTPRWPGRPTTGWAWPRRRWSRPPATWPATSGPPASGSTWSPPARCARSPPAASPASPPSRTVGRAGPARLGHRRPRAGRPHRRRPPVGLVPGHDRRDRPRRRRRPRGAAR